MHYARKGIITPEMEYIAIRENMGRERVRDELLRKQHPVRALAPTCRKTSPPNLCARKWPKAAPSFPPTSTTRKPSP
ncbi:hypothetical protein MBH78_05975 [Oceanimonas sp. NS1]|nr:hypothetical protein [Oceanimonas sp. NS1]